MKESSAVMETEPNVLSARAQLPTHMNKELLRKSEQKIIWSFLLKPTQGRI